MAGRYDFTIDQGSTFAMSIQWRNGNVPVDLTGYKGRMQIRYNNANGALACNLDDTNGGLLVDMFRGTVNIYIDAETTAKINVLPCVYDLEMVKDEYVERILEGKITISPEVTK